MVGRRDDETGRARSSQLFRMRNQGFVGRVRAGVNPDGRDAGRG